MATTAPSPPRRRPHPARLATVVMVAALTLWHASEASEHLLTDRDPGVYNTAARWVAREGTLLVDPAVGPFADRPGLRFEEQGWHLDDEGRLEPQFLHLLPAVLALAHVVGGDRLLLLAPAAVAGGALLAFAAFTTRLVRPWWALVAAAGLAATLPWVHLSRDAFSEPLAVLLLFGGLTLLWDACSSRSWRRTGVAGLVLGGVSMARVEGFVILLPLVASGLVLLAAALGQPVRERRATLRMLGALATGSAVTTALAGADLLVYGTWYLRDLGGLLTLVGAALVAVVVAGAAALVLASRARDRRGETSPSPEDGRTGRSGSWQGAQVRGWLAAGAAIAIPAAAWFVRPAVSTVTGPPNAAIAALEGQEGRLAEGVRRYSEHSVQWLGWYVGPLALALGFVGLAVVVRRLVAHRPVDLRPLPFVAVLVVVSSLYLWRPSIVPDHVWAMRRYTIVTLPGLLLLAALAGQVLADRWRRSGGRAVAAAAASAVAAAVVLFPISTVVPVAEATTQGGMLEAVGRVCSAVGPRGAVVVVPGQALELVSAQALRSFCGVPVAIAETTLGRAAVADLSAAWAREGRALHLVGADAAQVEALAGRPAELAVVVGNDEQLEATLTERPDELVPAPVALAVSDALPAPAAPEG